MMDTGNHHTHKPVLIGETASAQAGGDKAAWVRDELGADVVINYKTVGDDETHGGEKIHLEVGNSYQMKIIKLSPAERKIGLSIRALKSDEYRADWESYSESSGTGTATLGDHFRNR